MEIQIDINELYTNSITFEEYITLYCLANSQTSHLISRSLCYDLALEPLYQKGLILTDPNHVTLDRIKVSDRGKALLGNKFEPVNFYEFINTFPEKTPSGRRLKPTSDTSQEFQKLKKKYMSKVKTQKAHRIAVSGLESLVQDYRNRGSMEYINALEVIINNKKWEQYYENPNKAGSKSTSNLYGSKLI